MQRLPADLALVVAVVDEDADAALTPADLRRGFTSVVAFSGCAARTRRSAAQGAGAGTGTGTGTTVTTDSSPRKSAGLVVNRGSLFAAAMLATIRSATRPRGLRPIAITSAAIIPYCRAASTSNGSGLKVASTRCTRS